MIIMSYLKLIRWQNCLIAALTVLCGAFLLPHLPQVKTILIGIAAAFCLTAFGNMDNDIMDIKSDSVNHPARPLPSGALKKNSAFIFAVVTVITGVVLSGLVNLKCLLIAAVATILLIIYNHWLKNVPLLSNVVIALISGLTFIFAGFLDSKFNILEINLITSGAIIAFLFHLGREIVKDLQDTAGDKSVNIKTFANQSVLKYVKLFVTIAFVILIVYVVLMIQILKLEIAFSVSFLFGIMIPLIVLLVRFWNNATVKSYQYISTALKILMPIGLATLLLARYGI